MKIELSRREFLLGAVAIPVFAALPAAIIPKPAPVPEIPTNLVYPGICFLTRNGKQTRMNAYTPIKEGVNEYVFNNIEFGEYTGYRWTGPYGKIKEEDFKYPITISNVGDRITILLTLRFT